MSHKCGALIVQRAELVHVEDARIRTALVRARPNFGCPFQRRHWDRLCCGEQDVAARVGAEISFPSRLAEAHVVALRVRRVRKAIESPITVDVEQHRFDSRPTSRSSGKSVAPSKVESVDLRVSRKPLWKLRADA